MGFLSPADWTNAFSSDPTGAKSAADTAAQTQMTMFNTTQGNLKPYMDSGVTANNNLNAAMPSLTAPYSLSKYQASPEAAVTANSMSDMFKQLMASSAAGGNMGSGSMATALQKNAAAIGLQGYQTGLQDYQGQNLNQFNMLDTRAGAGQNAAAGLGGFGQNVANNIGDNGINAATRNYAATNSGLTNLSNSLGSGVSNWLQANSGSGGSNAAALGTSIFGNSGTSGSLYDASSMDLSNASMSDSAGWFSWL
jgi:hypothetical protein